MSILQVLAIRTLGSLTLTIITVRLTSITVWFDAIVIFALIYLVLSDIALDIEDYLRNRS